MIFEEIKQKFEELGFICSVEQKSLVIVEDLVENKIVPTVNMRKYVEEQLPTGFEVIDSGAVVGGLEYYVEIAKFDENRKRPYWFM